MTALQGKEELNTGDAPFAIDYCEGHSGTGWYWWDPEYPEEGSMGPFASYDACVTSGAEAHGDEFALKLDAKLARLAELEQEVARLKTVIAGASDTDGLCRLAEYIEQQRARIADLEREVAALKRVAREALLLDQEASAMAQQAAETFAREVNLGQAAVVERLLELLSTCARVLHAAGERDDAFSARALAKRVRAVLDELGKAES